MNLRYHVGGVFRFVSSQLVDRLIEASQELLCLNNDFAGRNDNIRISIGHPTLSLFRLFLAKPNPSHLRWATFCTSAGRHQGRNTCTTQKIDKTSIHATVKIPSL